MPYIFEMDFAALDWAFILALLIYYYRISKYFELPLFLYFQFNLSFYSNLKLQSGSFAFVAISVWNLQL